MGSALGGCRRAFFVGFLLLVLLVAFGLFSAGPILQILLQILLSQ
jgi:hypothetical protein